MSIIKLLNKKLDRLLFTTPSHNQKSIFSKEFDSFYKYDLSEIEGFDNLSNPKTSILMAQGKASDILNTKQTFFTTQGSTTAILAAMKALINPGDRVLIARNCHKSVFSGLILTAGIVDWFMPDTDSNWGIYSEISPEKLDKTLELNHYKAFIMTSPTYEGINSNIEEISKICKKHDTYLIVDEAHGSLYNFSDKLPKTAIQQGADVSVNSLHKTAGALNQTALLNISHNIKNVEIEIFQKAINLFQTTSPSYPLLSNIEACLNYLSSKDAKNEIENLILQIDIAKRDLARFGIEFFNKDNHDKTKILVRKNGISGVNLSNKLYTEHGIEDELNNNISCLFLTGIGTTKQKIEKLKNALKKIETDSHFEFNEIDFQPHPLVKYQPVETFNRNFSYINKTNCIHKISNKTIIPYPPGIGILYPGEAIQEWHIDYLENDVEIINN